LKLNITEPLVSVDWLHQNIDAKNLIVIDATMRKITSENNKFQGANQQIKGARFFDLKNTFSDTTSSFPNMMLSKDAFEIEARKLGINKDSAIVIYDSIGIYTSPRVWWMFRSMGHENVAVLNGGLPEWNKNKKPTKTFKDYAGDLGDFSANYNASYFSKRRHVLSAISDDSKIILDARTNDRFNGTREEPRQGLRSGHIPKSKNLFYSLLLADRKMKSKEELKAIFEELNPENMKMIFSCGSGITACILALGAEISGNNDLSVYDGSWTEWGSIMELPIEN
jgi:thiosulfate/3-mercaptopyruvate sulfurtransferase